MTPPTARGHAVTVPTRPGVRPTTTPRTPHVQLDQFAPEHIQADLWRRMTGLPGVVVGPSMVSAPTSLALHLPHELARGPRDAFIVGTEFAHLHRDGSGSLHLALPPQLVTATVDRGWAEPHPAVALGVAPPTSVMVYGPRDRSDLAAIWELVRLSFARAAREEQES